MSSVDEMYNNGIKINNACYYSGINRITYYYRKKHENNEDNRHAAINVLNAGFKKIFNNFIIAKHNYYKRSMINVS